MSQAEIANPALKKIFDRPRLGFSARTLKSIEPRFDDALFGATLGETAFLLR